MINFVLIVLTRTILFIYYENEQFSLKIYNYTDNSVQLLSYFIFINIKCMVTNEDPHGRSTCVGGHFTFRVNQ